MAWGYGYGSRNYAPATPQDMASEDVEKLVNELHDAIDGEKLKDLKSVLAKLKLARNNEFPLYTKDVANFGAYIYAKNKGKKKSMDSVLAVLLKKNYSYDGFPLDILLAELPPADMKTIINDVMNVSTQWNLEGVDLIEEMYKKYPKETNDFVIAGRLNKYEKGENRTLTAKKVIELGDAAACVAALNAFFGRDYVEKYGINGAKLADLFAAVDQKSMDIRKQVRTDFFYKVAVKSITFEVLEKDHAAGLLDAQSIKSYTDMMINNYRSTLFVTLRNMKDAELRIKIIGSNDQLMNLVAKDHPDLMPKEVQDIFLF